ATVLKVSPWEAALGASLPVDTPFGSVTMKLPGGTQAGRKLRLKGKGLPRRKGALPGDLLVRVEMVIPEKLTDRERELLETLARESSFNPRG
ncbi:MAG TPA: DnaJ C-terminal domain-containing protein, partial [Aminivibrio sp.]|nr:DnaJ C-terminal domain-containing protein [Aminivibrio sp.]